MERHKRRWSVIYEGDVGSAWEWGQIKLHTSCDALAPLNQLKTTVVNGAQTFSALAVQSCLCCGKFFLRKYMTKI